MISKENKVNFVWAVHPGRDIKWTDNNGDGVIDDLVHCKTKFELMYTLGVRSFAVFFDDIGGEGAKAEMQAKMLNYLNREFVRKKGDVTPLIMCPTQYNRAWSGGDYLDILGSKMDKDIDIMWTGDSVCRNITRSGQDWINQRIKRKAYIWWNWPVSDYCGTQLLIGRTYGLDQNNKGTYAGFTSNPMDKPEASKIGLFGVADYCWNIEAFDSQQSWQAGIKFLTPKIAKEMLVFAEHNSDQGKNFHAYRREESVRIKPTIDAALEQLDKQAMINKQTGALLKKEFRLIKKSAKTIIKKLPKSNPVMFEEVRYWLEAFEALGQAGSYAIDLASSKKSPENKFKLLNKINIALAKMDQAAKNKKATEKKLHAWPQECRTGTLVMTPFVNEVFTKMASQTYKDLTGKSLSTSPGNFYKTISNVKSLKKIPAERKGKEVHIKRVLEVITLKPKQYIGLHLPSGVFAKYVHVKLDNVNASKQGVIEVSSDGKKWRKINTQNNGQEMHTPIDFKQKIRYTRYINTSHSPVEIKLNQFKFDIPENSKVNAYDAMFDCDFSSFFIANKKQKIINKKKAKQVFIIGDTKNISVVYKDGKTVLYSKSHRIKNQRIKSLKLSKETRINEIVWK